MSINLFPARVPIGRVVNPQTNQELDVLMTPEFSRALANVLTRIGGPSGFGTDDIALMQAFGTPPQNMTAQMSDAVQAIPSDLGAMVAAMRAEIESLRGELGAIQAYAALGQQIEELRSTLGMMEDPGAAVRYLQASYAPINSPAFTGDPTTPTPALGDNDYSIVNSAWVKAQGYITSSSIPVTSVFGRTGAVALTSADVTGALGFTPYNATNPSSYITSAGAPVQSVAGRTGAVILAVADVSGAAPLTSPALTGVPTAPTAAVGTNTTQLATTAHVRAGYAKLAGDGFQDFAIQTLTFTAIAGGIAKSGSFNRTSGAASGTVAITGVGFKPSFVIFICAIDTVPETCWGGGTVAGARSLYSDVSNNKASSANAIHFIRSTDTQDAVINSFDADGFTLGWTRTGTGATGNTIVCNFFAFR